MTFRDWIDSEVASGNAKDRTHRMRILIDAMVASEPPENQVGLATLNNVYRGMRLGHTGKALAIERATAGQVTAKEIYETPTHIRATCPNCGHALAPGGSSK